MDWYELVMEKEATPKNVKQALIECFWEGKEACGLGNSITKEMAIDQLKNVFEEMNVDWDHPTKNDFLVVISELKITLGQMVPQSVVEKHFNKMTEVINRME